MDLKLWQPEGFVHLAITALVIGSMSLSFQCWSQDGARAEGNLRPTSSEEGTDDRPPTDDGLWVEVETIATVPSDITGVYLLVPYRNRREKWAQTFSLGLAQILPKSYTSAVVSLPYADVYGTSTSMFELQYSLKRNFALGSIGAEVGAGLLSAASVEPTVDSKISFTQLRFGANLYLDNLYYEPYIVPYGGIGGYILQYKEALAATTAGGSSGLALYFTLGIQFQLNWLDKDAARTSYMDYGIENTFLYVEGRSLMASSTAGDPNFSTGFDLGGGARIEF